MGRTACTEPQCLYMGDLYLCFTVLLNVYRPVKLNEEKQNGLGM